MTIQRMDHVGIVVDDLAAATEFFVELGLEVQGEASVEGGSVDRIIGLNGVRSDIVGLQTPDGNTWLELSKFHSPPSQGDDRAGAPNTRGLRHIAFIVDNIDANQVKKRKGQVTTDDNFRADVNADGFISADDLRLVRSQIGMRP